jgi:hypothetical protein
MTRPHPSFDNRISFAFSGELTAPSLVLKTM